MGERDIPDTIGRSKSVKVENLGRNLPVRLQ
jgi:hypothetical protein